MSKEHIASDYWPPEEGAIFVINATAGVTVSTAPQSLEWKNSYVTIRADYATAIVKSAGYSTASITAGTTGTAAASMRISAGETVSWRWKAHDYLVCAAETGTCQITCFKSSGS